MTDLIFLDTETTGLDDRKHQVWEIAWAVNDGTINTLVVDHDISTANPDSLDMNGYWERAGYFLPETARHELNLRKRLKGNTLVCSNPPFDRGFLKSRWMEEPWHHRSVDISSFAMLVLGHDRPMGLARVAQDLRDMGYEIPNPDHSARGDVETLRACYMKLLHLGRAYRVGRLKP